LSSIGVASVIDTDGPAAGVVNGGETGVFGLVSGLVEDGTGKFAMLSSNSVFESTGESIAPPFGSIRKLVTTGRVEVTGEGSMLVTSSDDSGNEMVSVACRRTGSISVSEGL
jgi:hypothetical protein